jgi:hypothetical protein
VHGNCIHREVREPVQDFFQSSFLHISLGVISLVSIFFAIDVSPCPQLCGSSKFSCESRNSPSPSSRWSAAVEEFGWALALA